MRNNIKSFIELASRVFEPPGPVVEIGALQTAGQEGYADLRPFFAGREYLGCDAAAGPGVDRIEDVHGLGFADASVGTIVCADTLEHVAEPARAVAEMHRVLRPGGLLILSTPFAFPIHYMPDYVRYTPEGLSRLLGAFEQQAVFGQGDAQNPHTVQAVGRRAGGLDGADFAARAAELEARWMAAPLIDALLRFTPQVSVLRRGGWPGRASVPGRPVEQALPWPRAGVVRVDALLGTAGAPRPTRWRLRVLDAGGAELAGSIWIPVSGDQRWTAFPLPHPIGQLDEHLRLHLEPYPGGDAPAVAFLCDAAESGLVVDGTPAAGSLCVELFCPRPT